MAGGGGAGIGPAVGVAGQVLTKANPVVAVAGSAVALDVGGGYLLGRESATRGTGANIGLATAATVGGAGVGVAAAVGVGLILTAPVSGPVLAVCAIGGAIIGAGSWYMGKQSVSQREIDQAKAAREISRTNKAAVNGYNSLAPDVTPGVTPNPTTDQRTETHQGLTDQQKAAAAERLRQKASTAPGAP